MRLPSISLLLLAVFCWSISSTLSNSGEQDAESQNPLVKEFSIYAPYLDSYLHSNKYDVGGTTVINVDKYYRLTPDYQSRKGWIWSKNKFSPKFFSVDITYHIHGKGTTVYGDGFAFWMTSEKLGVGNALGASEKWNGLGILFDTYQNGGFTYADSRIQALINDGTKTYNKDNDGKEIELAGCNHKIRNIDWETKARFKYVENQFMSLELNVNGLNEYVECFRVPSPKLPKEIYFGFTGETGGVSDAHDIIEFLVHDISGTNTKTESPKKMASSDEDLPFMEQTSTIGFIMIMAMAFVVTVAYFGFKYVTRTERNKRF